MRIAFVASEVYPFSKTGGLADVASALPRALAAHGCEVTVFTPLYESSRAGIETLGQSEVMRLNDPLWVGDRAEQVALHTVSQDRVRIVFVENDWAFSRSGLYLDVAGRDYVDNAGRFALLCRAVLEYCLRSGHPPDIFHANDWQTALLPVYLKTGSQQVQFAASRNVFTIHNLGYQGIFPAEEIYATGLGWELFTPDALEYYGQLNLLKGGIAYCDALTTVSPGYAKEIQTPAQGMGLDGLIREHRPKLRGILNGIDTEVWDPQTDPHIAAHYSPERPQGKSDCKAALQKEFGLKLDPAAFVMGMVSRFDQQKGVELALDAWPALAQSNIQLVLLGSGAAELQQHALMLAAANPGRVGVVLGYHEALAHRVYAGADSLLMPSLYEPCGLNQMYAQRYGAVPIVRSTGGLRDTVRNCTPARLARGTASGFTFAPFNANALAGAIRSAYRLYSETPADWAALQRGIMQIDNSWTSRAQEYMALYKRLTDGRVQRAAVSPRAGHSRVEAKG